MGPRLLPRPPRPLPLPTPSLTNLLLAPAVDIQPYAARARAYTPLAAPSLIPLPAPPLDFDTYWALHNGYEGSGRTADTRCPAIKSFKDIQQACFASPFPGLATDPGTTETLIADQVDS
ncbi:hypothetical protein M422DRAFT_269457 [Sphaerobolus stellatus SS14]|uniref:Fungal ligninase C-terminal domain-containing protein n=1 Tax=Sphaerobolus stellatus (strain SS14) TaxID=990650 RepID=A0A0C9UVG8_SPHS4|nr:hypothetical protein M422DRAFT_269457 [Sphaerobolus stellatus SS14]